MLNYLFEPFRESQFTPKRLGNVDELINSLTSTVTLFDKTCITAITRLYEENFSSIVNDMLKKVSTTQMRALADALSRGSNPTQKLEAHYKTFLADLHDKTMVTAGYGAGGIVNGVLSYYHPVFIAGAAIPNPLQDAKLAGVRT